MALVAALVYALHGYRGMLPHDLGVFMYGGLHVLQGEPPYTGIFNSVGPLADLVPAAGIALGRLAGLGPVLSARLLLTLVSALACALVYVLARDTFRSRAAGFVSAAAFLTFADFADMASGGPREKTTMVLLLVAALVLVGRRRWLGAGVCTALATLAWQPVLAVAATAAAVGLLTVREGRLRGAAAYLLGCLVPIGVAVAWFAAAGGLGPAVDGFVVVNVGYTHQPSVFSAPLPTWRTLVEGYGASLGLVLGGLVALLALSTATLLRGRGRGTTAASPIASLVPLGAACAAGTACTTLAINGSPDLFVLLPFAALGVGGTVVALGARLRPGHARVLVGTLTVAATVAAAGQAAATRDDGLVLERRDVAAVLAAAPPGADLVSVDAPEVMVLAGRDNPSRYQLFNTSMQDYLEAQLPGGLGGIADHLARTRPTLIAASRHGLPSWADALHQDYRFAGRGPCWTWYVARSAGRAAADEVRAANTVVMRSDGSVPGSP